MRRILITCFAIFGLGFYLIHSAAAEGIDLKLREEIGLIFINKNMILVMEDEDATLLVLDKDKISNINKFSYKKLNIVMLKDININLKGNTTFILEDEMTIGSVTYSIEDGLIYISFKETNMCIYLGGEHNISNCQFLYFYNTKVPNLTIYDYNEIVLYYYKNPLSNAFLEKIYEQSVDTYQLRDDELTIIKLSKEDYEFIVIDND
ncbi:MAG: hypothetical protein WC343_02920 [Bacilli bacterium]|jgi:hypothetical protein